MALDLILELNWYFLGQQSDIISPDIAGNAFHGKILEGGVFE